MKKAKFKIGDRVKVTNFGKTYTTYEDMFELMGFKNTLHNWALNNRELGTIFGVQLHENQDVFLYAVRTADDREALIGEEGLIKVEDASKMYNEEEVLSLIVRTIGKFGGETLYNYISDEEVVKWFDKVKKK